MSSFQKNTLLTFLLLAFVAYPPLFYSIQDVIKKETRPKEFTSAESVPFVSLGELKLSGAKLESGFPYLLHSAIDFLFSKSGKMVYLGTYSALEHAKLDRTEFVLHGELKVLENEIIFTPKLDWLVRKKKYEGEVVKVRFDEIGYLIPKVYESLTLLFNESLRLGRILKETPNWAKTPFDELMSESEWKDLVYKIKKENDVVYLDSDLVNYSPNQSFIRFLRLNYLLTKKTEENYREIWKSVGGDSSFPAILKSIVSKRISLYYLERFEYSKSLEFALASKKERENFGSVYHPDYADTLSTIGHLLVYSNKKDEALFYLTSAKEMFESLGLTKDQSALDNSYLYGLILAEISQRELAGYSLSAIDFENLSKQNQYFYFYNLALTQFQLNHFDKANVLIQKQRDFLNELELSNHDLSLLSLNLQAAIQWKMGKWSMAQSKWESILNSKSVYSVEDKPFYRYALFNLALLSKSRGKLEVSESYYKQYTRLTSYNQIQDLKDDTLVGNIIYSSEYSFPQNSKFTELEEKTIRSYTGRYIFYGQDEEIRARTYENRLEDTNLFLSDLIEEGRFFTPTMNRLKRLLFGDSANFHKGNNIVFFDIGPALNHPEYPGVTSLAVAKHFPEMEVVLWELPSEVELFLKKVQSDKKDFLYSFKNIRILSADGVGDFEADYANVNNWILKNRPIPKLKGKTIIFRSANSIDIYEPFTKIEPHFLLISKILKDNPVLYFFNRSILLKPMGSEKFTLIGNQSIRGFHHNFQSLDRNGEAPYTLLPYTLLKD